MGVRMREIVGSALSFEGSQVATREEPTIIHFDVIDWTRRSVILHLDLVFWHVGAVCGLRGELDGGREEVWNRLVL